MNTELLFTKSHSTRAKVHLMKLVGDAIHREIMCTSLGSGESASADL